MHITNHAERRIRKRIGIPKRTVDTLKDLAYENGLRRKDCHGKLRRYMDSVRYGREDTTVKLYNNFVWIFCGEVLVTVYPIPAEYQRQAAKLLRRKNDVELY